MPERHPVIRQVYVTGGLLAFVASFVQLYEPTTLDSDYRTMNLWSAIGADDGGPAVLGVLLVLALVATAVVAGTRTTRGFGVPVAVLSIGTLALLMLLLKPGTGSSPPAFGPGASIMLGTTLALIITALVDALVPVHLRPSLRATPADPSALPDPDRSHRSSDRSTMRDDADPS